MSEQGSRRGLGRGLSALLGETAPRPSIDEAPIRSSAPVGTFEVSIEQLFRNPDQPRQIFNEADLLELAESVRSKGILQAILCRPLSVADGTFQIVAGERRWRAAQRAGLRRIPITVRELDDLDVLEIGIVENVQRADLTALEEAAGYRALIERFGRTQDQVATTVGKSRAHVANALRLLNLPKAVQDMLAEGRLTSGHARAIAASPDVENLAGQIVDRGLSVRQAEGLARKQDAPRTAGRPRAAPASKSEDTLALELDLSSVLGVVVQIEDRNGEGELVIRYTTLEQLDDVCRRLSEG